MPRASPDTDGRAQHALELAYRYLNDRDRTEAELRRHLSGKGLDPSSVEEAVARLRDQGYLDDLRFVRLFAEDKRHLEQWGNERISRTLVSRGVDRELVAGLLVEETPGQERERALELLRRRVRSPPWERRERERAFGVLVRKGFDPELASEVVSEYARERP